MLTPLTTPFRQEPGRIAASISAIKAWAIGHLPAGALALKNRQEYRGCIVRMDLGARYEMRQHPLARHPAYGYL